MWCLERFPRTPIIPVLNRTTPNSLVPSSLSFYSVVPHLTPFYIVLSCFVPFYPIFPHWTPLYPIPHHVTIKISSLWSRNIFGVLKHEKVDGCCMEKEATKVKTTYRVIWPPWYHMWEYTLTENCSIYRLKF